MIQIPLLIAVFILAFSVGVLVDTYVFHQGILFIQNFFLATIMTIAAAIIVHVKYL